MRIRCLISVFAVSLGCIAAAQDESQSVKFAKPAGLASGVIADLSIATKVKMRAAPTVGGDVLYLNLKGVPLNEAMKRIAGTLHAEWRKEGETYILDRPLSLQLADERTEAKLKAARLKKGIDQLVERYRKQAPWSDETARRLVKTYLDAQHDYFDNKNNDSGPGGPAAKLQAMASEQPGGRALVQILSLMTQAQLERMCGQTRAVFSTRPNRMQVAMPNGADAAIQQLIKEMRMLDRAMKDAEGNRDRGRIFVSGSISPMEFEPGSTGVPAITILRAGAGFEAGSTYVQMTVADANGESITHATVDIPLPASETAATFTAGPDEKPIILSDIATRYSRVMKSAGSSLSTSMMGGGPGQPELIVVNQDPSTVVPATQDLLEQILNPDKYEPMRLAPTEGLDAVADQLGKSIVAYIPDTALLTINNALVGDKVKPSDFLSQLQSKAAVAATVDGDWIQIEPTGPASSRRQQVNRAALAKALNLLVKQGYLSLEDLGVYASQQLTSPAYSRWDRAAYSVINPSSADQYFGYQNPWWLLRLYGTLSSAQRQVLLGGQQLPIANLTAAQHEMLATEVFRSGYGVKIQRENEPQRVGAGMWYPGLFEEVTYALPNGLTREGYIQVKTTLEPAVQTLSSATGAVSFLPFGGMAWTRMNVDRPDLTTAYGPAARADKYRMATKASHAFTFQFSPQVTMSGKLADMVPDKNAKYGPYESLPADFRSLVEGAASRLKDLANDMSQRRQNGGSKPPGP
jgi:hypothetical protein